jgi:RNA polymerase sigma-70 factor (ECF subfamily)
VARRSYGRLLSVLVARGRDVAAAEDALADAFAAALSEWPMRGVPAKPEAWLLTVARRRAIDRQRRQLTASEAARHVALLAEEMAEDRSGTDGNGVPDSRLALMFACAHPAIDRSIRAPLMLQTVLGFDAVAIASAFLVAPATMGQRLVRAKSRIREAGIPFRLPERSELPARLDAVLEAIYAVFAEGWTDPGGTDPRRRDLAGEAIWLGRLVASLLPEEAEALGLLALMLFAEARRDARRTPDGEFVPLAEQDSGSWDRLLIDEAEAVLSRASRLASLGRYQIEAALQSVHCARRTGGATDWPAAAALYGVLGQIAPSPVVDLNRAVAIAECGDLEGALAILESLGTDRRLAEYQPYWAARGMVMARLNRHSDAHAAYMNAMGLERDPAVRRFLQTKLEGLRAGS